MIDQVLRSRIEMELNVIGGTWNRRTVTEKELHEMLRRSRPGVCGLLCMAPVQMVSEPLKEALRVPRHTSGVATLISQGWKLHDGDPFPWFEPNDDGEGWTGRRYLWHEVARAAAGVR